ncbi:MAG TPA: FAD-binding oxidoreductase [Steroidobacteraceae bacterium]|nr:FAD-binding oxidoreductase [Steroidobacteraceae bacterium]
MSTPLDEQLKSILGAERVQFGLAEREFFSTDLYSAGATCAAVVRPADAQMLAATVAAATRAGYAVVPRGGGLTYVGGYTPPHSQTITVDCADLNRIIEVNSDDMYISVEAGVTWKQIDEALSPLGLRLPFFGTFSGASATVGGGLSNGAMFLGSARYGSAAETVLGMEIALADGTLLQTGHGAVTRTQKPVYRSFGPDITGLFVHDCGAFGIKTKATLRVISAPQDLGYLSFLFATIDQAAQAMSEIARRDLVEEIYIVDPIRTRQRLHEGNLLGDLKMLGKVVGKEKGLLRGLQSGLELIKGGKNFLDQDLYSLHMVCAGRSRAAVDSDLTACADIARRLAGTEIPNSIPKATRAMPFPALDSVLGASGDRWVALNCKIAHSEAAKLLAGTEAIFTRFKPELDAAGVVVTVLISAMGNHVFSYECVFRWFDRWLPPHKAIHPNIDRFVEPPDNPSAREAIARTRQAVVDFFYEIGAASAQIGRTYRYLDALTPEARGLLVDLKQLLDSGQHLNPGVLGFGVPQQGNV